MKTALIVCSLFLLGGIAQADNGTATDNFTRLKAMYDNGTLPSQTELTGWFSGRCFSQRAGDTAWGSLIVSEVEEVGDDSGPLLPPKQEFKIRTVGQEGYAPDTFDTITPDAMQWIGDELKNLTGVSEAQSVDGSLMSAIETQDMLIDIQVHVKRYKNYFITETYGDIDAFTDPQSLCYYFKKVHN